MIKPITYSNLSFSAEKTPNPNNNEYKDPLLKWPLRGAAFTNELGEGLRPLIGSFANLFWAPVFLYIGADVYDKYKNDGIEHSPNSRRLIKEACFQGLASIILPLVAIKGGQNIFSLFGHLGKDKISCNKQEKIIELAKTFVANGNMRAFENNDKECIDKFKYIVNDNLEFKSRSNLLKKVFTSVQKKLKINKPENIEKYAEKTIKELIETRKNLLNPTDEFKSNKKYANFKEALKRGETQTVATKSVLTKMLNSISLNSKIIKTIGGFIAVAFAISPIDKFVEHTIIEKYLGPKIDNIRKA